MTDILWLDNDVAYVNGFEAVLQDEGYSTKVAGDVTEAESLSETDRFRLLILDVMIPTQTSDEELRFPPDQTDAGHSTGLLLYKKWRTRFEAAGTKILVFTVRLDSDLYDQLRAAGLPEDQFATKLQLCDATDFLTRIRALIGPPHQG